MSGRIEPSFFVYAIFALAAIGAATDLLRGRIYNWLTAPATLAGLVLSCVFLGWSGGASSLFAIALGFALYGWMFWVGAIGGGDVKFLMALGAWGGSHYVVEVAILGVLLGGLMALGSLLARGRFVAFLQKIQRFALSVVIRELEVEKPRIDASLTLPFGVPIAIAGAWIAFADPFVKLGVSLW